MNSRLLTAADAEAYRNLRLEGLQNNPEAFGSSFEEAKDYPIEHFADRLESQGSYTLGVFDHEELVGVATLVQESKLKLKHKASIFAVYVSSDKRGLGIGKRLMVDAINKARELKGVEQLTLTVVSTNASAKRLYSSLGFEVFGTEKKAMKIGQEYFDEDYMVLFL
ncbi:GNAT family N-acetyltransferase [Lysinibacillus sp. NPDC092081]|uniref:GNAT family N-acetyltransferase n=1 Tax=Lysinibacillus sp. NPDC092081 TaxID=3364131 RepID=UPI0038114A70